MYNVITLVHLQVVPHWHVQRPHWERREWMDAVKSIHQSRSNEQPEKNVCTEGKEKGRMWARDREREGQRMKEEKERREGKDRGEEKMRRRGGERTQEEKTGGEEERRLEKRNRREGWRGGQLIQGVPRVSPCVPDSDWAFTWSEADASSAGCEYKVKAWGTALCATAWTVRKLK